MSEANWQEPVHSGQLSPDGNWVWDGAAWQPSVSPDGQWRWDGQEWKPLTQGAGLATAAPGEQLWPQANDIDDASQYASGDSPPKVDHLPSDPLFRASGVAIGRGWVAHRPLKAWHLLDLDQLRSVAIVPPSSFNQWRHNQSIAAPDPDVALQDRSGCSLRITVGKFDAQARQVLGSQIPSTAEVTPAASGFLQSGNLPGKWGKRFQFLGKRFG
jgi:hypothetical protein